MRLRHRCGRSHKRRPAHLLGLPRRHQQNHQPAAAPTPRSAHEPPPTTLSISTRLHHLLAWNMHAHQATPCSTDPPNATHRTSCTSASTQSTDQAHIRAYTLAIPSPRTSLHRPPPVCPSPRRGPRAACVSHPSTEESTEGPHATLDPLAPLRSTCRWRLKCCGAPQHTRALYNASSPSRAPSAESRTHKGRTTSKICHHYGRCNSLTLRCRARSA